MTETPAPSAVLIAVAAIAVLGLFFWYVAYRFRRDGKRISAILDAGSQRRRERLDREARQGRQPAWQQALRRLIQIVLILALLALAWLRLRGF